MKPCNLGEWATFRETWDNRRIAQEDAGENRVSTVFIGMDMGWNPEKPLVFETMVFDKEGNECYCTRASTYEEAEQQHKEAVEFAKTYKCE